ncbi:hypothetical protein SAY86_016183 [Trapa natans]|uniref:Uncharacterized protein n=1 Tax=Trapa natans TaxID=22666 RepID=A0AAN7L9W8_TRANT|nr:hypothetical protein SAY86_016183 [Trapa natans]
MWNPDGCDGARVGGGGRGGAFVDLLKQSDWSRNRESSLTRVDLDWHHLDLGRSGDTLGDSAPPEFRGRFQQWGNYFPCLLCARKVIYRGQERRIFTCYPDNDLETTKEIMEARDISSFLWLSVAESLGREGREGLLKSFIMILSGAVSERRSSTKKQSIKRVKEDNLDLVIANSHLSVQQLSCTSLHIP